MQRLAGRVAIVTGAGRGLGRSHALFLAAAGARVVVNDLGTDLAGGGLDPSAAHEVVRTIREQGGEAVASGHDVAEWDQAGRLVGMAVEAFGDLHVLVNNAGIVRDRTLAKMSEKEWDAVIRVNLKGHAAPTRHAISYWRDKARRTSRPVQGSLVHTSSASGFAGNFGQANYAAAKMGVIALSRIASLEAGKYGVRSNVIAPVATTRLALTVPGREAPPPGAADPLDPAHVSPLVGWLAAPDCPSDGQIFHVYGERLVVLEIARIAADLSTEGGWTLEELDRVLPPNLVSPPDVRAFLPASSPVARAAESGRPASRVNAPEDP